jgi:hypothetical protein
VKTVLAEVRELKSALSDVRRTLKQLAREDGRGRSALEREIDSSRRAAEKQAAGAKSELAALRAQVAELQRREAQLRAIAEREAALEHETAALDEILHNRCIGEHVRARVAAAAVETCPCPLAVIDDVLPASLYRAALLGLPPPELFTDRTVNRQHLQVPFRLGPVYGRRVWTYLARTVVREVLVEAIVERFREPLAEWLRLNFPFAGADVLERIRMTSSDGRIMLRTRGYVAPPHRDPRWGFISGLLYLAREADDPRWGTQFYEVDDDSEPPSVAPLWIDQGRCRLVNDVSFVPNRLLVFLNSTGAHGASIPATLPEPVERYIYQVRIAPDANSIAWLMESLPDEKRSLWAGKIGEY